MSSAHESDEWHRADFLAAARAVDDAIAATETWPEEYRNGARELQRAIEAFHTPVLENFVRFMRWDDAAKQILFDLVDDPHVRAVLTMHGIIRSPEPTPADDDSIEASATTTIIPIESIKVRQRTVERGPSNGWVEGPLAADVAVDDTHRFDTTIDGEPTFVLFTNVGGSISAFRNACVHQGLTLDGARVVEGVITCPWHGFTFDAVSGECISAPGAQLERYECRVENGRVWIAP